MRETSEQGSPDELHLQGYTRVMLGCLGCKHGREVIVPGGIDLTIHSESPPLIFENSLAEVTDEGEVIASYPIGKLGIKQNECRPDDEACRYLSPIASLGAYITQHNSVLAAQVGLEPVDPTVIDLGGD